MPEPPSNEAQGSPAPTVAHELGRAPDVLGGRYRLVSLIARGGMAEVWEGIDEVLARPVAVKILLPHLAQDQAFVRRFRREAIAAARLSHPNIVALFDTCSDGDTQAIVMELVRGSTLRALLDEEGQLSPSRAIAIGAQVADALEHAHRSGLIHRDVKPGNVLLSENGRVLVADFGIAKAAEGSSDLTEVGQVVGTAKYLSPEQVEGQALDARSDVYSLGVVLYEALCGRPPFTGESSTATALARLTTTPLTPSQLRPGLPRALEEAVLGAMARRPEDRHLSAAAFREALLAVNLSVHDVVGDQTDSTRAAMLDETTSFRSPVPDHGPSTPAAGVAAVSRREHSSRRRWVVPTVLLAIVAATLALVGVLVAQTELGQDLLDAVRSDDAPEEAAVDPATGPESVGEAVALAGPASSFDPPPGDGRESDGRLEALTDGDPETTWSTERYVTRNLGGLKDGVGVVLPLADATVLSRLEVDSPTVGWAAAVHVADDVPGDIAGWGEAVARVEGVRGGASFDLGGRTARNVLLWFTDLGDGSVGSQYLVEVSELRLAG